MARKFLSVLAKVSKLLRTAFEMQGRLPVEAKHWQVLEGHFEGTLDARTKPGKQREPQLGTSGHQDECKRGKEY